MDRHKRIILNALLRGDKKLRAREIIQFGTPYKDFHNFIASAWKYEGNYYIVVDNTDVYGPFSSEQELESIWINKLHF